MRRGAPIRCRSGNLRNNDPALIEPIGLMQAAVSGDSLTNPGPGAIEPMPEADIGKAVQLLDRMLEFFADDGQVPGCESTSVLLRVSRHDEPFRGRCADHLDPDIWRRLHALCNEASVL
jgi:hypothetical protein